MNLLLFGCVAVLGFVTVWAGNANTHQQVHIALGGSETEMVVTWVTIHHVTDAVTVEFGVNSTLGHSVKGETTHFQKDGASFYTHRALITGLKPATRYYYRVGSKGSSWSEVFTFKTLPSGDTWLPRVAVYGDLGFQNEESLPFLTKDVDRSMYDVIFHVGDFAYNLDERKGEQGNDFMRSIEKVAARVPYQTIPGNHEERSNFTHYDARFSMLGDRGQPEKKTTALTGRLNNFFHSVDIGPAHIIMFSSEIYFYTNYGYDQIAVQYKWLEADLKKAAANRAQRPWIIAMGHRSVYCIRLGDDACDYKTLERPDMRMGIHMHKKMNEPRKYGLEDLFYKYGVDLVFAGHAHFYARMLPMYNFTVMGGSREKPYENPHAPIHIITGSAGNREEHAQFNHHLASWVANHALDYGYTRLTFKDRRHILFEQTSDDKSGVVIDKIDIIKSSDKPRWLL